MWKKKKNSSTELERNRNKTGTMIRSVATRGFRTPEEEARDHDISRDYELAIKFNSQ
jgi:hypothetical protein